MPKTGTSVQANERERIDRYEIVRLVHRGAMGTIYKATDKLETETTISPKQENVDAARGT